MTNKWKNERRGSTAILTKNELCIYFNNDEKCGEFYKKILSGRKLINMPSSRNTYKIYECIKEKLSSQDDCMHEDKSESNASYFFLF